MSKPKHTLLTIFAAVAIGTAGCTTQPRLEGGAGAALEQRAEQEVERGNLRVAAQLYRELADTAQGTRRAGYLIEAAGLAIARDDPAAAAEWLREAETTANREQRQAIVVLQAEIELDSGRAAEALARLEALRPPVPVAIMTDRDAVRGRALFRLGRAAEAVRVLIERETWLDTSQDILDNQRMIWNGLAAQRTPVQATTGDATVDGWLALAPVASGRLTQEEQRRALLDWRLGNAGHPAATGLLAEMLGEAPTVIAYPRQVALLLPISTPQRAAAIAIRDGFLAAHFVSRQPDGSAGDTPSPGAGGTTVRVYDTGLLGAREAYMRAQMEGADFIVGPLLRQEVEQILPDAGLVPTLALNFTQADGLSAPGFYQFALAPEDEARAVARQAYDSGARTAVALVQSTDWGYRLLNSFREEFEALGGRFLGYNGYDPAAQDFSGPIESLLNIDRSERRRTRLQANLGAQIAFEPRRRQDVDMIFLGADRSTGRLLAPALRFHFAGDIPAYATSEIYEPGAAGRESDLNGIYFPDAPWLLDPDPDAAELRRSIERFWPQRTSSSNIRLYGMGVDAYGLVGALYGGSTLWPIEGVSGNLALDADGRVRRLLGFAQFRNGRPVALEPPATEVPLPDGRGVEELVGAR